MKFSTVIAKDQCSLKNVHTTIIPTTRNRSRTTKIVESSTNTKKNSFLTAMPRHAAIAASIFAMTTALSSGQPVYADPSSSTAAPTTTETSVQPIYFGNGCFWGRQYDFIQAEKGLGRKPGELTAVVGYAAGKEKSKSNKTCYYYTTERDTIYETLGHAEVVQVELKGQDFDTQAQQFRVMAKTFFNQFKRVSGGKMMRQDPQDAGPGYRNVIGLPGGINSPFFKIVQEENINNMQLLEGKGGGFSSDGKPLEDDIFNAIWVVDSEKLPFNKAEVYHQYHNGLGKSFPTEYTKNLKKAAMESGIIGETGCPEYFFMNS